MPSFDGGGSTISGGGSKTAQPDEGLPTCHRCRGNGEPLSDEDAASLMASKSSFQDGTAMTQEACLSQIQKRGMSFRICECTCPCPFGGGKECLNFRCGTPENIAKGKCPLITQSSARLGNNKGGKKWGNFQSVPRNRDFFKRAPAEVGQPSQKQLREPSDRSQADSPSKRRTNGNEGACWIVWEAGKGAADALAGGVHHHPPPGQADKQHGA